MYIPKKFIQEDKAQLKSLIKNYPLAALVSTNINGLEASHIPLQLIESKDTNWKLMGHIARANPLWKTIEDQSKVLVIFQGPQSYISPNWYPTKREHGKVVPTWNYAAIHITGVLTFIHDTKWKMDMLNRLTNQMESDQPKSWKMSDAPGDFIEKQLNAIVGIEILVSHAEGKWKLSQNQPEENQKGVIHGLSNSHKSGERLMAEAVKNQSVKK